MKENKLEAAQNYSNIADRFFKQGAYDKCLIWNKKALAIDEKVLGEHPTTAVIYSNIGNAYIEKECYAKALRYHKKALLIREKILGKNHYDTCKTYNNLASTYYMQGNITRFLEYIEIIVEQFEDMQDELNKDAAICSFLANTYLKRKNLEKSVYWSEKGLASLEKELGKNHPSILEFKDIIATAKAALNK